ncbi:Hypothetical predicted protein, partial [Marmota monax]
GCSPEQLAAATAAATRQERKELNARPSHQARPLPPPPPPPLSPPPPPVPTSSSAGRSARGALNRAQSAQSRASAQGLPRDD